jgi:hypothetical protein
LSGLLHHICTVGSADIVARGTHARNALTNRRAIGWHSLRGANIGDHAQRSKKALAREADEVTLDMDSPTHGIGKQTLKGDFGPATGDGNEIPKVDIVPAKQSGNATVHDGEQKKNK